jgi:hypothetical protein
MRHSAMGGKEVQRALARRPGRYDDGRVLARLLLIQVRKLLDEVARVVRTWRTVRRDLALHRGSAEERVCRPESQVDAQECGAESEPSAPGPELP